MAIKKTEHERLAKALANAEGRIKALIAQVSNNCADPNCQSRPSPAGVLRIGGKRMIYLVMKRNRHLAIVRDEIGISYRWRPFRSAATRFCREDAEMYARIYNAEIIKL